MLKIKDIALMSMMLAILIVCSKIKFNIGPIPVTLQTFAVIIISYILGVKKGLIVFGLYIFLLFYWSGDRCNFAVPWIAVRHTASICMYDRVISNIHSDMVDIFISSILSTSFTVKD